MFKKITLVAALVAAVGFTANAQWFDFSNNSKHVTAGITIGEAGHGAGDSPWGKPYAGVGVGGSLSFLGIYADCLINGPEFQYDNHVRQENVEDQRAFTVNFGYQIPVLPWLRIAPIIGYSQTSYGYTDYSSVNIEVDSETSTGRMYHDYLPSDENHEFNFGAGIFIHPFKYVELSFIGTKRAIYGGLSFYLGDLIDEDK